MLKRPIREFDAPDGSAMLPTRDAAGIPIDADDMLKQRIEALSAIVHNYVTTIGSRVASYETALQTVRRSRPINLTPTHAERATLENEAELVAGPASPTSATPAAAGSQWLRVALKHDEEMRKLVTSASAGSASPDAAASAAPTAAPLNKSALAATVAAVTAAAAPAAPVTTNVIVPTVVPTAATPAAAIAPSSASEVSALASVPGSSTTGPRKPRLPFPSASSRGTPVDTAPHQPLDGAALDAFDAAAPAAAARPRFAMKTALGRAAAEAAIGPTCTALTTSQLRVAGRAVEWKLEQEYVTDLPALLREMDHITICARQLARVFDDVCDWIILSKSTRGEDAYVDDWVSGAADLIITNASSVRGAVMKLPAFKMTFLAKLADIDQRGRVPSHLLPTMNYEARGVLMSGWNHVERGYMLLRRSSIVIQNMLSKNMGIIRRAIEQRVDEEGVTWARTKRQFRRG